MSTARQAIAARRKTRIDPRYAGLKSGDTATAARRLATKVKREQERRARKGKKGKKGK